MEPDQTNQIKSEEKSYVFPKGIPGFENHQHFFLKSQNDIFNLFQSASQPDVAFITINPFDLYPDYEFELSQEAKEDIDVTAREQVFVQCIVTWHSNIKNVTVNLLAPIIFNSFNHTGKQVILQNTQYSTKHAPWAEDDLDRKGGDL